MSEAVRFLKANGAEVVEIEYPEGQKYEDASFEVMLFEFKDGLNKYFASLPENTPVKNVKELIEFNKSDSIELKYFDQAILELAEKKADIGSPEYKKALSRMLKGSRENGIDLVMSKYKIDAIIAPTGSPAWKTDLVLGDHFIGGSSSPAAISGYPAITVPMGFIGKLPVGITFYGKAWSEPKLLEIAYSYEQGTRHRKTPKYFTSD
jgi:amidase